MRKLSDELSVIRKLDAEVRVSTHSGRLEFKKKHQALEKRILVSLDFARKKNIWKLSEEFERIAKSYSLYSFCAF